MARLEERDRQRPCRVQLAVKQSHFELRPVCTAATMLAGCGGSQPPIGAYPENVINPLIRDHTASDVALGGSSRSLPPNLLYVAGGPRSTRHPFIEVFNALDMSPTPQPIYTIPPKNEGEYGLLAVDNTNDLFAVNYFTNGADLLVVPSGATKPTVSCQLDHVPQDTYISDAVLYVSIDSAVGVGRASKMKRSAAGLRPKAAFQRRRRALIGAVAAQRRVPWQSELGCTELSAKGRTL